MIGNRVRIVLVDGWESPDGERGTTTSSATGVLHKLDAAGAVIWREHSLPEGQGNVFVPMHRIHEIVDLGRAP